MLETYKDFFDVLFQQLAICVSIYSLSKFYSPQFLAVMNSHGLPVLIMLTDC